MGYADAQWTLRDFIRHPNEAAARERCLALARAALGQAGCDALMAQGRELRDDQVAELAFADDDLG